MQKLLDFDVAIEPLGDRYRTRVVASPCGEAHADFVLPFTDQELEILILRVISSIGRPRRKVRAIRSPERRLLENFGGQLFQAAFSGPVQDCLGRSRLAAENRDAGLRIRLRLPQALANIPWEYLYDVEYGFICLSSETVLVRYVETPIPVRPFPISPPLRILAMISAPSDVPGLDVEEEWGNLNNSLNDLGRRGMVEVDRLDGTLAALQRPLRLREYHVLHFVGHGGWDEDAQDGVLVLEGPDRRIQPVTGRDLGILIRGHRSLRLVVLNACEGARSARDDPFGGVAQALVRQGIPAVVAMQFEISDPAAIVFSQAFYQAIAEGLPVDVAMVEARRAMFAEGHEIEWATPVLYLRSPDGRVFTRDRARDGERAAPEEADRKAHEDVGRGAREHPAEQLALSESASEPRSRYDVYFSYIPPDRERVKEMSERLRAVLGPNFRWFDEQELELGGSELEIREQALRASGSLVVVLGPGKRDKVSSEEVSQAIRQSRQEETPAFFVYLPGFVAADEMETSWPYSLTIDLREQFDEDGHLTREGLVLLIAAVRGLSPREADEWLEQHEPGPRTKQATGEQIKREAVAAAASVTKAREERETQAPQLHQPKIFLCYRHEDTQGFARGIYESLASKYGRERVYRDIDSTPAGVRYATWIESRVSLCSVMIVLIGNTWSSAKDPTGQRRLDLPKDWVRHEIEAALRRDIPIIPVRVQGAPMPSENELPSSIADLTGFQSAEVTDSRWDYDVGLLIQAIDNLFTSD
jgi:hypothetical protein